MKVYNFMPIIVINYVLSKLYCYITFTFSRLYFDICIISLTGIKLILKRCPVSVSTFVTFNLGSIKMRGSSKPVVEARG